MKKIIRLCFCILALALVVVQPLTAAAAPLNPEEPCSLTLHYSKEGTAFADLDIRIFRVAVYHSDGSYTATDTFANYPVKIQGMRSQKEWQESTTALVSYVEADALTPTATAKTDAAGTVVFDNLPTGLYLVMGADARTETGRFRFQPFFIFLPTPDQFSNYTYQLEANPKPGPVTPISEYTVVKLWKDSANQKNRPTSVSVELLKDGVPQETVELNQENNWSYSWETTDVNSQWSVAEKNVPAGYTVSVSSQDGAFTITNEYPQGSDEPPKTGDTAQIWPYVIAMCASGIALVILGSCRKRKRS